MSGIPLVVIRSAAAFGLEAGSFRRLGGSSGSAWSDGQVVIRVGERIAAEVSAASAAAAQIPVPRILDRIELDCGSAVLLEIVRGWPAGELALRSPEVAGAAGRACGALHARLNGVAAPLGLRQPPGADAGGERRLLHLDLHPFNVLVDEDGQPTGVIDWANAAAGDPELDRARTWTILTLDPAARRLRRDRGWAELTEHWLEAGRLDEIRPPARAWACRFMLADLAARYTRAELAHVRHALHLAETTDA
jgi:Phosphotransferase enzyme family